MSSVNRDLGWRPTHTQAVAATLVIGLLIRFALVPYGEHHFDVPTFRFWGYHLVTDPLNEFYHLRQQFLPEQDHLPGDLWFLWGITQFYQLVSGGLDMNGAGFLWLLKLVPAVADIGIGLMLYVIGAQLYGRNAGLIAAALFVFNPASIFLTGVWGQWDSVSAFFALVALWSFLSGRLVWVLPALCYATLIKPQFGALLPLFALACYFQYLRPALARRGAPDLEADAEEMSAAVDWRDIALPILVGGGISIVLAAIVLLPFGVGIGPIGEWSIIERMRIAVDMNKFASLYAFNLWTAIKPPVEAWQPDNVPFLFGVTYQVWGTALTLAAYASTLVMYARRPHLHSLVWAALVIMLLLYILPTRIHERYLFPALVLAVLPAMTDRTYRYLFFLLSFTYFINLWWVYTAQAPPFFFEAAGNSNLFFIVFSLLNMTALAVMFVRGAPVPADEVDSPDLATAFEVRDTEPEETGGLPSMPPP